MARRSSSRPYLETSARRRTRTSRDYRLKDLPDQSDGRRCGGPRGFNEAVVPLHPCHRLQLFLRLGNLVEVCVRPHREDATLADFTRARPEAQPADEGWLNVPRP